MHIPDGFISAPVAITTGVVAAGAIAYGIKATSKKMGDKQVPMMGVLSAFIFAAQMLNFPIAGGTSGHFVGTALVTILLGPWSAIIILSSILLVQCLVFQDGGLLALGANIFNMGIVAAFSSHLLYKAIYVIFRKSKIGRLVGGFAGAWVSVVVAALFCAAELAISGTSPWKITLATMGSIHALIGIGEGFITVAVLGFIMATRSDLLELRVA